MADFPPLRYRTEPKAAFKRYLGAIRYILATKGETNQPAHERINAVLDDAVKDEQLRPDDFVQLCFFAWEYV